MNQATQLFDEAQAEGERKLRVFLAPFRRRAHKLGFRPFFKVEPELLIANGTTIPTRLVTIKLVPESPKAKRFCKDCGAEALLGTDRYVDLENAEECIAGAFEAALELAKGAR
jgi:hypothetical protein